VGKKPDIMSRIEVFQLLGHPVNDTSFFFMHFSSSPHPLSRKVFLVTEHILVPCSSNNWYGGCNFSVTHNLTCKTITGLLNDDESIGKGKR